MRNVILLMLICVSVASAGYFDANGVTSDGVLSDGEYAYAARVDEDSILTVTGGGADGIRLLDNSQLHVYSTAESVNDALYWIVPSDSSTLTFSGGVAHYIYVQKDASVLLDGGQINYIRSIQKPTLGITITIDCQYDSWDWIYDGEDIVGITGLWHNGDEFSIGFLNDTIQYKYPDTWTHVQVIPEPASITLLTLGGLLIKRKR